MSVARGWQVKDIEFKCRNKLFYRNCCILFSVPVGNDVNKEKVVGNGKIKQDWRTNIKIDKRESWRETKTNIHFWCREKPAAVAMAKVAYFLFLLQLTKMRKGNVTNLSLRRTDKVTRFYDIEREREREREKKTILKNVPHIRANNNVIFIRAEFELG